MMYLQQLLHSIPILLLLLSSLICVFIVPLGLPGSWILLALSFVYSLFYNFDTSSDWTVLLILAFIAGLAELFEFFVSVWGGKKFQVSNGALIASIVGGLLGAIIGVPVFLIGSLLGLLLGTFLGAFLYEYIQNKIFKTALYSALAVFFSRLVASFVKTSLAFGMWIFLCFKVW